MNTERTRLSHPRQERRESIYTIDELAHELGVGRQTVYLALKAGRIPAIRLNKRYVLPRSAIQEWLKTAAGTMTTLGER